MWSDSIFLGLDRAKIAFLSECCFAAYYGLIALRAVAGPTVRQITDDFFPGMSFHFFKDGESILLVNGTMYSYQYGTQFNGWETPIEAYGGEVNRTHLGIANLIYNSAPNGVTLTVGHSAGGATAHMLAQRYTGCRTVTFGCPRYCDLDSVINGNWPTARHFFNANDPVPGLPYFGFDLRIWYRAGSDILITEDGFLFSPSSPASNFNLVYQLWNSGVDFHSSLWYAQSLGNPPRFSGIVRGNNMPSVVRAIVKGAKHNQAIVNQFWYRTDTDGASVTDFGLAFKNAWYTWVGSAVAAGYAVQEILVQSLGSVVSLNPALPSEGSAIRWSGGAIITDTRYTAAASGVNFPTFNAVGVRKFLGPWRGTGGEIVSGTKIPRGGWRTPPPPESSTAGTDDNSLTAAALNSWKTAADQLLAITVSPHVWSQVVVSTGDKNGPFMTGTPPLPTYRFAYVLGNSINPYVTSQLSRKQTKSRLG